MSLPTIYTEDPEFIEIELPALPPHDPARFDLVDDYGDPDMTNGKRAKEAASLTPEAILQATCEENFTDIICNMLHLAHSRGMDASEIASIIRASAASFIAEAGPLPLNSLV